MKTGFATVFLGYFGAGLFGVGLFGAPSLANDSMAELKTGGLIYVRTDAVAMERENLFISLDEIRVDYVFRNRTDQPVSSLVAFPMPEISGSAYEELALPQETADNFLGFFVKVNGHPVTPQLEQRAVAYGIDITEELRQAGVSLVPSWAATHEALSKLAAATIADWTKRGIIENDAYYEGDQLVDHPVATWTLRSSYWWHMEFPAGEAVRVSHTYRPSVGGTVGVSFLYDNARTPGFAEYEKSYCIDKGFEAAVKKRLAQSNSEMPALTESWISYVLTTARNWHGPIGRFELTIDKGATANLVSFCATGVKKIAPTQFQVVYEDFMPERDLQVLFLVAPETVN